MGVGVNFALPNENESGDPNFLFVFLKGYIKVYGIKTKFFEIVYARFLKEHSITFILNFPQNM